MKYLDEFRDSERVKRLLKIINSIKLPERVRIMEVCGTHTMSIRRFGIHRLVEDRVELISGPGCPVCVTTVDYIDRAVMLSELDDVIITTFGDLVKVPGTRGSLSTSGGDVRVVYSPIESLKIAMDNQDRNVVFLAVGFETTVPGIALTVKEAMQQGVKNFYILEGNKIMPPPIRSLLDDPEMEIDAFLLPGHVCTVSGYLQYEFIVREYGKVAVVSGFEPVDILLAILEILKMVRDGKRGIINMYPRAVKPHGNRKAMDLVYEIFQRADDTWRGLGLIPLSGLKLRNRSFSAEERFELPKMDSKEHPLCLCGEILKGKARPDQCRLFGTACTPDHPIGPCMVSSEGTCAAYYKFQEYLR